MRFYQVNVYDAEGRFISPIERPRWGKDKRNGLIWKRLVFRSHRRAIVYANQRTVETHATPRPLLHNVSPVAPF